MLVTMQFVPLDSMLFLEPRADGAASFGDVPFYLRLVVSLQGAPIIQYQAMTVISESNKPAIQDKQ
jgi:hypothetical protein